MTSVRFTRAGTVEGARRLFPVALFVVPFGLGFGAAAVERGLSPEVAVLMSAVVFSGAAQFAALDVWAQSGTVLSLAAVALAVNARHVVMGAALAPWLNGLRLQRRLPVLMVLSDANFADAHAAFGSGRPDVGILFGGGLALWSTWVAGTAIGAYAGHGFGDPKALGVDVIMICFFAAVVAGHLKGRAALVPVPVAALVAVATLPMLPHGWNIVAGAVAGGLAGGLTGGSTGGSRDGG